MLTSKSPVLGSRSSHPWRPKACRLLRSLVHGCPYQPKPEGAVQLASDAMAFTFESDSIFICPYICPHSIKSHRPKTWPRPFPPDHWKSRLTHSSPNYLHKSLNHQNPVTGLLWKGKSRSLKHFKLKSQRGFSTLVLAAQMIPILIVRFLAFLGLWRNREER